MGNFLNELYRITFLEIKRRIQILKLSNTEKFYIKIGIKNLIKGKFDAEVPMNNL